MNIKIEVDKAQSDMTQADSQRIRRVANVLRERGDKVTVIWNGVPEAGLEVIRDRGLMRNAG
jgi:hypothetical protein